MDMSKKCIRKLGIKSLKASKSRNIIAIIAIMLTAILFTTFFTILFSINASVEDANFRQIGTYSHGEFKALSQDQYNEIKDDPIIKEYGLRIIVGTSTENPFNKEPVEISYCDTNQAKWMYLDPIEGSLPTEGTNEAATDIRVLELLGIKPEIGVEFTLPFVVDGTNTAETFTLCGWWEYNEATGVSHVLVSQSYAEEIFAKLDTQGIDGMTGKWNMGVMLDSSLHISSDMYAVLANHGYEYGNGVTDNTVAVGVNWGYTGAQLSSSVDLSTVLAIVVLLLLIFLTGFLIIYNVFQISVTGDIRLYGLLKTIGASEKQIRHIIHIQATLLSLAGIPLGLLCGWVIGVRLTPAIIQQLNGIQSNAISANPLLFIGAALVTLIAVLISCSKPGKTAAQVSPVEAVRYTEVTTSAKELRDTHSGTSIPQMALANLGRNRSRTIITFISLSLAVVLLNLTFTFTSGFDMDKYLNTVVSDYVVADDSYFDIPAREWQPVEEQLIAQIDQQNGVVDGGRVFGLTENNALDFVTEEYYRSGLSDTSSASAVNIWLQNCDKLNGLIGRETHLLGLDDFALSKLTVLEGDVTKLNNPDNRYIAAVYRADDYGNPMMGTHWAKVGDTITIRYVEQWQYYDWFSGQPIANGADSSSGYKKAVAYRDVEYEVAALVVVPHALGYRYYGPDPWVLSSEVFIADANTSSVMLYAFDTTDEANDGIGVFLKNQKEYGYESKTDLAESFYSLRDMFTALGGVLCVIIGFVGMLNFLNAILTGIFARKREFAVLQAIGMTGRQLKAMLVWEGLFQTLGSVLFSTGLCIITAPILKVALEAMFWFFSYQFTITPVLVVIPVFAILGIMLPLIAYHIVAQRSIVDRLREE